jgi:dipeptidyl-peptidase-4
MRLHQFVRHCLAAALVFQSMVNIVSAQSAVDADWMKWAVPRLKSVYELGEFRSKRFAGEWLPDSSGYTLREKDADTNKEIVVRYDALSGERTKMEVSEQKRPDSNGRVSPDGGQKIEFDNRNLFVRDLATGRKLQITDRPDDRDIWYREPSWSPDGKHIVFIESDETEIRQRAVLVPSDPSYPGVRNHRFARVGEKIAALRVGLIDVEKRTTKWLDIEQPDEGYYLGQVGWAASSQEVLVEKLSRFRDTREFLLANIETGDIRSIYKETNEAWAVGSQGKNSGLTWIRDGQAFIVVTEKDGWRHAYRYSRDGKDEQLLTPGDYDVIDRALVDEDRGWYYFYASPDEGTRQYLYRVPLDGAGTFERVTPEGQPGTHEYDFSPDARWAFHTYSTLDSPPVVELVELPEHRVVRVLEDNSEIRQRFRPLLSHPTEFLQLDIGDGVVMDALMIKPKNFDETKKYPVLVYVYGEPYAQTVLDKWGAGQTDFHRVVADLGYLVVSIDNRGTPAPKGAAWRRSIFGSLGPLSTEDQAAGIKELGRMRSYVDLSRVAIWGWSGGGSNTLNAMFRKPDVYQVGIAVVPKPQPHLYNAWFQEIYMRTRKVNADGYKRSAPINFAEGLQGDLLMITGSGETNTHIQIIEGLVDRLIELGKPFDYMVYPNRDHGLREGRGSTVHVRMTIIRYLLQHLPAGGR